MLVQFVTYLVIFVSFSPLNMPLLLCSLCHKHSGMLLISSEFAELTARTTSFCIYCLTYNQLQWIGLVKT